MTLGWSQLFQIFKLPVESTWLSEHENDAARSYMHSFETCVCVREYVQAFLLCVPVCVISASVNFSAHVCVSSFPFF